MGNGKIFNHLGRKKGERKSLLIGLSNQLIKNKRIVTTLPKAKVLRSFIEKILTKAKKDTTHARRNVFSILRNKFSVKELFDIISKEIAGVNGGYCRIIKLGNRFGDNAKMCIIEFVYYNKDYIKN